MGQALLRPPSQLQQRWNRRWPTASLFKSSCAGKDGKPCHVGLGLRALLKHYCPLCAQWDGYGYAVGTQSALAAISSGMESTSISGADQGPSFAENADSTMPVLP